MNNLHITLEPAQIAACTETDLPDALKKVFGGKALQHQVDVYNAAKDHDLILDLSATGTGKTKAGFSVVLENPTRNVVYVAPTNALVEQQTIAAEKFVKAAGLPHVVKAASAKHVNSWPNDRVGRRAGEKIYNVLQDPSTLFPECGGGRPVLLVTNPDIFYYAAFFQYNRRDRSNIASIFYKSFATVIFDEFHLYDAKQLVSLLFYLAVSHVFGYFQNNRKVVLLTATPEPACEEALKTLETDGVRVALIDGNGKTGHLIPSQTAVNLEVRSYPEKDEIIREIVGEVCDRIQNRPDDNGAVILDSKDTLNAISTELRDRGYEHYCGRITGDTPKEDRPKAAQKQVILATSTVDVGFNFEREIERDRQNLDWLIFSSRDRFSFWQRIGRVGRVLGKVKTDISSHAIVYLPQEVWQQGLQNLDGSGGREALQKTLESLECMQRPFLNIYWRSEAFLEIARPLLELETSLINTPGEHLISQLYQTLQSVLGGNRPWKEYRQRMKILQGAENIAKTKIEKIPKDWKYIKGGQNCVKSFLKAYCSEDWEDVKSGRVAIEQLEQEILSQRYYTEKLKHYARILQISYAPLFRFRDSLFENVKIEDPKGFLLDNCGETNLDPLHLLRFYEFVSDGDRILVTERAKQPYNLSFSLNLTNLNIDLDEFANTQLSKLYAFQNCQIQRGIGEMMRSTAIIAELTPPLLPGVIVKEHLNNRWAIFKLKKQGLDCYPITVCDNFGREEKYTFFPSLSGILAIATAGFALKCPDNEEFWCV
ncbi:type I-D CRISPR-associated helicase Cas3' [Oxynema aestuarii]|uniref:Type I-D CRISPR-associated helicase Cas3 n=1 Tax=Oxynema aestuarii AP17 TaxID=2064643 RepID=A0A6H1TUP1_9CYAN|nr:type I-D CRISPR-associated helicase Cas3' [Oxynema aestuarii]QIZ69926.1 type I-D CRISPR-associated helicase Cas3' [Oxynema aestuarii AP17]